MACPKALITLPFHVILKVWLRSELSWTIHIQMSTWTVPRLKNWPCLEPRGQDQTWPDHLHKGYVEDRQHGKPEMSKQTSLRYNNIRVKNLYALARRFNGLCVIIDSMAIKYACICWCQWFLKQVSSHSLCNFWMRRPYPRGYTCVCFSFGPPFLSRILLVLPRE